ncbi:MAG TPA: adenine phosphoribosyltransferase, partial [Acidimicrobiia bacterium]
MTDLRALIRDIPDYPKPGILFYDITPVLGHPDGFSDPIDRMADPFRDAGITKVAGIEARGFNVEAPV